MEQQQSTRVRLVEDQQAANSDITEQELMRRKDFLEFGDDDVANLTKINDLASQYAASVIEDFYKHLLSFEETRTFFRDPQDPAAGQERSTGLLPASDPGKIRSRLRAKSTRNWRDT